MEKIIFRFKRLSEGNKRKCLTELSDLYDVTINYDLIVELKQKIQQLEEQIATLKNQTPVQISIDEFFINLPTKERKEFKQRVVCCFLYKNLKDLYAQQIEKTKQLNKKYQEAILEIIKLRNNIDV